MNKQKTASASKKNAKCTQRPAGRKRGASQNGRSAAKASAKKQSAAPRRTCTVEQAQTRKPKASGLRDLRGPAQIDSDLRLLRLARFPEQEPGVSLDYLLQLSHRRHMESVWRSVTILTALEYLAEVTLSDGSTGFALTELAVEREGLLSADELALVRLPSEATIMQVSQLTALTGRPEDEVLAQLRSLARRRFLKVEKTSKAGLVVYPTARGMKEAGFNRAYYRERPAQRQWGHTFKETDVRLALIEEFVPVDGDGNREWGSWQWVSERMRSRVLLRTEKHLPDGFLVNGRKFSLAAEVARSTPDWGQLLTTMEELAGDNTEVRYYSSSRLVRNRIIWAQDKLQLPNVKLLEMPGEPLNESERARA